MKLKLITNLISDATRFRRASWEPGLYINIKNINDPTFLDASEVDADDWEFFIDDNLFSKKIELKRDVPRYHINRKPAFFNDCDFNVFNMPFERSTTPSPVDSSDEEEEWCMIAKPVKLINVKEDRKQRASFFAQNTNRDEVFDAEWPIKRLKK